VPSQGMTSKKKIALTEIADKAGVSTATVSRVLNERTSVSDATRDRVLAAYRRVHQALPITSQAIVGLIVPDSSNPFFSELEYAFERALERAVVQQELRNHRKRVRSQGVHLITVSSEGDVKREIELGERLQDLGVKGIILIGAGDSARSVAHMAARGLPVLVFDRRIPTGDLDSVVVNSHLGTRRAVDYLCTLGHQRIGYLRGLESTASAGERFAAFVEAMAAHDLAPQPSWIFKGRYDIASGRECGEALRGLPARERPTAMLAGNDLMAIGLMQDLQEHGWKLPEHLSVIGFDGIRWADWVYPRLTTIAQPIDELVTRAVRLLLRRIERTAKAHSGGEAEPDASASVKLPKAEREIVEVAPELRIAESTAAAPARGVSTSPDQGEG
jgi:LacI family transcriptional regulator